MKRLAEFLKESKNTPFEKGMENGDWKVIQKELDKLTKKVFKKIDPETNGFEYQTTDEVEGYMRMIFWYDGMDEYAVAEWFEKNQKKLGITAGYNEYDDLLIDGSDFMFLDKTYM